MRDTLVVILPSYDEDPNVIDSILHDIRDLGFAGLVVSNVPLPHHIPHIVRPGKIGYGNAIKEGLKLLRCNAAYMDADGTYVAKDLGKAFMKIKEGADLVIVRRFRGKLGKPEGMSLASYLRNLCVHILILLLHRRWIDTQSGLKVMSNRMREAIIKESREGGMTFSLETVLIALKNGFRIEEVQGEYRKRESGKSKLTLRSMLEVAIYTLKSPLIVRDR
ncbi:MAG: hypothetical protein QXR62_03665 [Candidatus Bathyarchaeia archaeon]